MKEGSKQSTVKTYRVEICSSLDRKINTFHLIRLMQRKGGKQKSKCDTRNTRGVSNEMNHSMIRILSANEAPKKWQHKSILV